MTGPRERSVAEARVVAEDREPREWERDRGRCLVEWALLVCSRTSFRKTPSCEDDEVGPEGLPS